MIATLLKINWLNLRRDYVALGLTFVLPIVFFSIFAFIFGGMGGSSTESSAIEVIVVDRDQTDISARLIRALDHQAALHIITHPKPTQNDSSPTPYTREQARTLVRKGKYPAAVVFPDGFARTFGDFGGGGKPVEIIHDPSNPIVVPTISGLLQAAAITAAPDVLMEKGMEKFDAAGGALTPTQRALVQTFKPILRGLTVAGEKKTLAADGQTASSSPMLSGLVNVKPVDAGKSDDDENTKPRSLVAYYAAGISVMFLLFSMASGAGGSLLEEQERGTLERVLATNIGMKTLLLGHWLFFSFMGIAQIILMFVWAAVVFNLDLWSPRHLLGFVAMTVATACAASAFGIVLATICKSRTQLGGVSTIVILIMSALGGSMIPRFIMPAFMNTTALFTFNGWALDGYLKVFWYENTNTPLIQAMIYILPQLGVLAAMTVVFLGTARLLAKRWETA